MIGSLIGAGVGAVGSIFGGIASSKAAKKQNRLLNQQKNANQAWYERNYNQDYTQRADVQAMINKTREFAKDRYKRAEAMQAVTGATDESVAMQKEAGNEMIADVNTDIASQASQFKQNVDNQKLMMDNQITMQQAAIAGQQAQSGANLMSNGLTAGAGAMQSLSDSYKKKQ